MVIIDGVEVTHEGFVPFNNELAYYVEYVKKLKPNVVCLHCRLADDGGIDLEYTVHNTKFERIRRITGYLVGDITRWNDSKIAEERDRLKHDPRL